MKTLYTLGRNARSLGEVLFRECMRYAISHYISGVYIVFHYFEALSLMKRLYQKRKPSNKAALIICPSYRAAAKIFPYSLHAAIAS